MAFVDGSAPPMTTAPAPGSAPWMIGGAQVRDIAEGMVKNIWKGIKGVDLGDAPFRVIPYEVAMDVYGSDKPDTRYEMYTLPIGYYPTLSDASLDKILMDENQSTVEWMVTPAQFANAMDVKTLAGDSQFVSSQVFEASLMTVLM
jgi:aspartyl-tRNA synthetase